MHLSEGYGSLEEIFSYARVGMWCISCVVDRSTVAQERECEPIKQQAIRMPP
jgi:hypothetical protein